MKREEILAAAEKCVNGNRQQDYGHPENSFQVVADLWNAYFVGIFYQNNGSLMIDAKDVAALLALLKIGRISTGHGKGDNWVDLAGYAACGGELEGEEATLGTRKKEGAGV